MGGGAGGSSEHPETPLDPPLNVHVVRHGKTQINLGIAVCMMEACALITH